MVNFASPLVTEKLGLKTKVKKRPVLVAANATAAAKGEWRGQPSLWNFEEDGVSQSFLHTWLGCREHARLKFVEGWTSRLVSFPIEFGSCVHWLLEQACREPCPPDLAWLKLQVKKYAKLWTGLNPAAWTKQIVQQEKVYGYAEAVLPAYFKAWPGDFGGAAKASAFRQKVVRPDEWCGLEEMFKIPYVYPDGFRTFIRGKRDGVFLAKKKRWLFETKTKARIDEDGIQDTLPTDLQVMMYLWGMAEEKRWDPQQLPQGVLYNIIRTPGHRQLKDEALHVFCQRIAKEVALPSKKDHFFIRFEMPVTLSELRDWKGRVLDPIMLDVRAWVEGKAPHYPNPDALMTKYGHSDMFEVLTKGSFDTVFKRKTAFTELSEFSL